MGRLSKAWRRFRFLFGRADFEGTMDEEMRFHLEMKTREYLAAGLSPAEARAAALRSFGNVPLMKEDSREVWGWRWLDDLLQDLRFSARLLAKSPGFTLVVVMSLALGIGANTAIFSFINAVMLKLLPVKDPGQLVALSWTSRDYPKFLQSNIGSISADENGQTASESFPYPAFEELRAPSVLSHLFAFGAQLERVNFTFNHQAHLVGAEMVSGNYFSALGVLPLLGRPIFDADNQPAAPGVAVLSYAFWKEALGGDPAVVGKAVHVNGFPFTVVGVAPLGFFGTHPTDVPDLWVPLSAQPQVAPRWFGPGVSAYHATDQYWVRIMGRLKPGVSQDQARTALDLPFQRVVTAGVNPPPPVQELPHLKLMPGGKGPADFREELSRPLFLLMGVVSVVLLIACANVANLLLARATVRQKEVGLRLALGASRTRLLRQLLTEVMMLAFVGGILGLILAYWGTDVLRGLIAPEKSHLWLNIRPDRHVLEFTAALSLLTGILFGIVPALRATRVDLTPALQGRPRGSLGGPRIGGLTAGKMLAGAQVAMSFLLLVVAGLLVRTLVNLKTLPLGFNQDNLLVFAIDPTLNGYQGKRLVRFYQQLLERIETLPGVRAASLSQHKQVGGGEDGIGISVPGYKLRPDEKGTVAWCNRVGPNFLRTMDIKLLLGRELDSRDDGGAPRTAVVNEAMARHYFGTASPLGRHFSLRDSDQPPGAEIEIVGVAQDVRYNLVRREPVPTIYLPLWQDLKALGAGHFEVSTSLRPIELVSPIRRVVQEMDKDLPIFDAATQRQQIADTFLEERLFVQLTSFFGLLAMALAAVGVYGLMAYSVARRTGEIGIRMALGARQVTVLWMVLRESLWLAALGIAVGMAGALAATRVLASLLFGLSPTDPATIVGSILVMAGVAALAGYLPARRAARVDPLVALRYE